jgi:NNP family nitrate/nitrite transporter-like MFS transporter
MPEFRLQVDENNKATEFPLWKVSGSRETNPHMRAFWGATISFFLAFLGWFALAPLALDVASSMGICENQLFDPLSEAGKKRPAFLKFKNLKTEKAYCIYGQVKSGDKVVDCKAPPPDVNATQDDKYDPGVLSSCVCSGGTECKSVLADAGIASVASTILVRISLGTLIERLGPVNCQCALMTFGAIWVAAAALISASWNFILIRFFIGMCGATFVTNQFWCSLMFAPRIVGTANATAGGWGNLGGGVTQVFMVLVLFNPFVEAGMEADLAWRIAMLVPAALFLMTALGLKCLCQDTPTKRRFSASDLGKTSSSMWDYVEVLKDVRVVIMIFQYSACFGTELAMNNQLATHFRTYFQMKAGDAATLAACFGMMNLFARSLGGITSDFMNAKMGFRGRIWAQFLALFFEAIFLFIFGNIDNGQPWYVALIVLICFSTFVQMAEGTSYGIVPFMNRKHMAIVAALVGAGGNLGAVIAGFCFYKPIEDELLPFKIHAAYVMFWALLSPCYYWKEYGGMFSGPAETNPEEKTEEDKTETARM